MSNVIAQMANWDTKTISIYVSMIIISTLFAKIYASKSLNPRHSRIWIALSLLATWIVIGFSTCGADYLSYERIFLNSNNIAYWRTSRIERGYLVLNFVIRLITDKFIVFRVLWALIFLLLIYSTIIYWENNIDVGMAVLSFTSIYCLQSMSLMRMYLAMAITMWGYKYYAEDKRRKYLVTVLVAMTVHLSAICLMLPLVFSSVLRSKRSIWFKVFISIVTLAFIYSFRNVLFSNPLIIQQYSVRSSPSLGLAVLVYHVPIVVLLIYSFMNSVDQESNRLYLIFMLCSFVFGMAGYMVDILGRIFVYYAPLYIIFPSTLFSDRKGKLRIVDGHCLFGVLHALRIMTIVFIVFRAFMMTEYFISDKIMPYTSLFISS